jgi:LmbE family N-acetylglucosaminyl deacetylase
VTKKSILVIAPHPDDETLGTGGFILKQKKLGNQVFVLNMTNMDEKFGYEAERVEKRKNEIRQMISGYNLDGFFDLCLKPAALDTYSENELIAKLSNLFNEIRPDTVILPYCYDIHSDHRITFNLGYACTKSFRYPYIKRTLMMETASETEYAFCENSFKPNYFVDISEFIDRKIEILKYFESEVGEHPFPRSERTIRANCLMRGAMSGVEYAEAFVLLKYIE